MRADSRRHFLLLALALIFVPHLPAGGPSQKAVRADSPPVVDGRLDENIWRESEPFSGFLQVFPQTGAAPSERTELRVAYDGDCLYLAVRCGDSDPGRISANSMAHDVSDFFRGASDDVVKVILDPFQDMRNAYYFSINARGGRSEGLASGERASLNWDGIWEARARIDEAGWSCEMAIPFRTLSFKPGLSTWGINVERYIPRKQETIRLSGIRQDAFFTNPAEAASLEGIQGIAQGGGLTIRPYGAVIGYKDHAVSGDQDWNLDGGLDVFKNFTPNLVGAVSVNTDFAETEVDDRRINLTRFDLFFPEKRAFFLQGSEYFSFGTPSGFRDVGFLPFFSRTIGICEEEVTPIALGAKVYGKLGGTNIAFLDVLTRDIEGIPGRNFLAARVSQNILAESKIGLIFTHGSPDGSANSLAGLDWTYQTSRFFGDRNFVLAGWAVYNWNAAGAGRRYGYGLKIDYPNDLLDLTATYAFYGDALDPGLGYLPRAGVQSLNLNFAYKPRPETGLIGRLIRQAFYELRFTFYWNMAGGLETRRIFTAPLNLRLENGARVEFNIIPTRDILPEPFEIFTGLILPVKAYDFTSYRFEFDTPNHLGLVFNLSWSFGPFYSGTYDNLRLGLNVKIKGYATLALTANLVRGRLAEGTFAENLLGIKADFYFTPDLGLLNNIQYDDVSGQVGANIRFRWRVSPGNEIFFVYNKNWERRWDPLSRFVPLEGKGVFKVVFSWRP